MAWIDELLARNAQTAYLRQYGSPRSLSDLPIVTYDDLVPWIERICAGESDVLFAGRPVAYERTSGSSGGAKLIPFSAEGLQDIQRAVSPWVSRILNGITGSVYLAISPATRQQEFIGGIPVGLPDSAYVGVPFRSAVPFEIASIADVAQWRAETVRHLQAARDLELISVWSPTFLLRLLDEAEFDWPDLKIISCWANGISKPFADELAKRFPHARIEPKGLMSTECIVTLPGEGLNPYGFFEFEPVEDDVYEVIATTASGLYRYRTGDLVRTNSLLPRPAGEKVPQADEGARASHEQGTPHPPPPAAPSPRARGEGLRLEFLGRRGIVSDLAGEKLTEAFVAQCVEHVPGFRFLAPDSNGYVLVTETGVPVNLESVETRLCENPQYAYARKLGQLRPLRLTQLRNLYDRYTQSQLARGARLGDIKPAVLRNEWVTL
jgi:hypothetical protein